MRVRTPALVAVLFALAVPAALAWPGRPAASPPKPPNAGAPPPAWIETQTRSAWLAYGSYCWKTSCVDMIPPASRPGLPTFGVARGGTVHVHLGFPAKSINVSINRTPIRASLDATKRIVSWRAIRAGILTISARASGGASYVARLAIR